MTTIKLKNGSGAPAASDLVQGEPALDLTNKRLYTEDSGGSVIEIGTNPTSLTTGTFTSTGIDDNASSTAITIDSSENVGIGIASPSHRLNVFSGAEDIARFQGAGSYNLDLSNPGNTRFDFKIGSSAGAFSFTNSSSELMRIDSSGNVGIGTASPSSTGSTYGSLTLSGSAGGEVFVATGGTTKGVLFNYSSDANNVGLAATDSSGDLLFSTGGFNERMRIDASGNVGIGTTVPSAKLSIHNSLSTTYSTTGYAATPSNSMLYLYNTHGGSNTASLINFRTGSGDGVVGFVEGGGTNDADFIIQTDGGSNGVERFRITNAGNVGIGTSAPQSLLQLNKTPPTAFGSPFLSVGFNTFTSSGMYTVAFGYEALSGSIAPAEIGLVTTSDSSFTKGDLVFATRDVVTNTAPTERMRIDSSGDVQIHGSSMLASSILSIDGSGETRNGVASKMNNDAYYAYVGINASGTNTFYVYGDGDVENTNNSYTGLSDARLKSNIVDASSQIDDIMAVQVRSYTLNETGATHIGVVAQELEASGMSGLVKTKDDGMKSVKYSVLYMKAIKALQEAVTRIETLEAEVAALKGA